MSIHGGGVNEHPTLKCQKDTRARKVALNTDLGTALYYIALLIFFDPGYKQQDWLQANS